MTFSQAESIWKDVYINGNWNCYTYEQRTDAVDIHNGLKAASDDVSFQAPTWGRMSISDRD